jgi:hypothetical protein
MKSTSSSRRRFGGMRPFSDVIPDSVLGRQGRASRIFITMACLGYGIWGQEIPTVFWGSRIRRAVCVWISSGWNQPEYWAIQQQDAAIRDFREVARRR